MNSTIGIVSCGFDSGRQFVTDTYIKAIEEAGGIPVVIPCSGKANFPAYTGLCNGFLFCGGDDISPLLFGEELLTSHGRTDWSTDWFHLRFIRHVLASKLRVLGICRGMQVLNLALGGSICQDLSLRHAPTLQHMQTSLDRSDPCHKIIISKNSILYNIFGESHEVNSFHHQCLQKISPELKITAAASDGVIEAVESTVHPFAVGVQWHPECMRGKEKEAEHLFRLFVQRSEKAKDLTLI